MNKLIKIIIVNILLLGFVSLIIITILDVTLLDTKNVTNIKISSLPAVRGNIYSEKKKILATSIPEYDLYIDFAVINKEIFFKNVDSLSFYVSSLFNDKSHESYKDLFIKAKNKNKRFFSLQKNVDHTQLKSLIKFPIFDLGNNKGFNIKSYNSNKGGLIIKQKMTRKHPYDLARRTIGIDRITSRRVGLEGSWNGYLEGDPGYREEKYIGSNTWIPTGKNIKNPIIGKDVITSINVLYQDIVESALKEKLLEEEADYGCVILMEVNTGYIKAITNLKRLDNGKYFDNYNNAIGTKNEPGSTFKLISLMIALSDPSIDIDITDTINTFDGKFQYFDRIMEDSRIGGHGKITIKESFEQSSNIGISRIITENYKGKEQKFIDRLYSILDRDFMLDIAGEPRPSFTTPDNYLWSGITLPWMSTGYEVEMTPLQILTIYNAVANGGEMMQPRLVKRIESNGFYKNEDIFSPNSIGVICSEKVSDILIELMQGVVVNGTAENIQSDFLKLAGKTGTTQINYTLRDKEDMKYQTSFAGFFPADDPKYSCIVVVNNPKKEYYANRVAAPVFKDIAEQIYNLDFDLFSNKIDLSGIKEHVAVSDNIILQSRLDFLSNYFNVSNSDLFKNEISNVYKHLEQGIIPDMLNYNAADASYIFNNYNIKTEIFGRGKVVKQIPNAGLDTKNVKTIKLFLM